jgi:flagellar biogenesis protein FliO
MIDSIGGFVQHNLIVFVAIILLPLKWVVVRLCKDHEAEATAIMSVPEDLCYIALGLVMGDIVNSSGAFHRYFQASQHISIDLLITVLFNLGVAFGVHRLSQSCARQFRLWRAADKSKLSDKDPIQGSLAIPNALDNIDTLKLRHLFLFSVGYAVQLGLVLLWLHWVAKVVANT